jgi:hypothetical protein
MNEQLPLNTLAPANHNRPPLSHLASASKNMQHPLINLASATLSVNELNAVNIPAQATINTKPLWLEFPTKHMRSSLTLLSLKELHQAASKSLTCRVNRQCKNFYIDTILSHFHALSTCMQSELFDNTHKSLEVAVFYFFSDALTETVTKYLMIPPCVISDTWSLLEDKLITSIGPSEYYNKKLLTTVLKKLHPLRQPTKTLGSYSFQDLSNFMIQSIRECIRNLTHPSVDIISFIQCFDPHYVADTRLTEEDLIIAFLEREYDADLVMHFIYL